jgi:antitoxin MazE
LYLLQGDKVKTSVQKWGHSLAVRIPKSFAEELGWRESAPVEMSLQDEALVVRSDRERTWDLDGLVAAVTDENISRAWDAAGTDAAGPAGEGENDR